MKRQRGRHNGRKPHHSQPHNPNLPIRSQTFDSNGPDVRVRGNAFQILEKYVALARDAQAAGDRVAAENYFQHAEHYFRLINESGGYQQQQQQRQHGNPGFQGGGAQGGDPRLGAGMDPAAGGAAQVQPAAQVGGAAAMVAQSGGGGATVTPTGYAAINAANAANAAADPTQD